MKKGLLTLFAIYVVFALSACVDTGTSTSVTTLSNEEILNLILEQVELPEFTSTDIDLPTSYTVEGYTAQASWRSTASSVMDSTGHISSNVSDRTVTLILTLTYEGDVVTEDYEITVLGDDDYLVLYIVMNTLINIPSEEISDDLVLPTEYVVEGHTVTAEWTSLDDSIMTSAGVIHMTDTAQEVELQIELTLNNATMTNTFTINVAQDPMTLPANFFHLAPVYTGVIDNEAVDPYTPSCFQGAIYRKVISSKDYWVGIEATLTLPEFIPDPERFDTSKLSYYLDNSSIYLGGNAYHESDVGLAWSIGYETADSGSVSRSGIAFRPFWRYITSTEGCTNNNCYRNASATAFEYYYFPGDTIRMSVFSPRPGYLQMRIELISETTLEGYASRRDDYNLGEDFNRVFVSDMFPSAGMGELPATFKRVNAIDQVSNEGKPTLNTNAQVNNAIWHEVYLYREIDGTLYKVPMTENRSASMVCPIGENVNGDFTNAILISYDGVNASLGGEVVTICPDNGDGTLYNLVAVVPKKEETI